jgi:hypothetical protein
MPDCFNYSTTYFWREGKPNMHDCLQISFEAAEKQKIETIVIFTGAGEGIRMACEEFLSQERYAAIKVVAVTFPHGFQYEISGADRAYIEEQKIRLVQAHLPFDPIKAQYKGHGILGQDFSLLGNALNMFGGGMSLCVQAVVMACDAGAISKGDHVIAMAADTSILVRSAPTSHLLTDLIVREILCKPIVLSVSKKEMPEGTQANPQVENPEEPKMIEGSK